jgi:hypothetical protein
MQATLRNFDAVAGIASDHKFTRILERAAFACLILLAISVPHSIAATQTAWLLGMLLTVARLAISPRPKLKLGAVDAALWAFFLWTVISAFMSYDQPTSLDKLRGAAVFLLVYFVRLNVRSVRAAVLVVGFLIVSCMVNVLWVPIERAIGRGVEIHGVRPESALAKARLMDGDTLLSVNGVDVGTPEELVELLQQAASSDVKFYRPDFEFTVKISRDDLLPGSEAVQALGIARWEKSHNWRSSGFYGHYATYAEVLQLIGSLVLGLLVALFAFRTKASDSGTKWIALLGAAFLLIAFALLLTVTRAPQLGLLISAFVIAFAGLGRKWLMIAILVAVPVAAGGLFFLQQSRDVGFFDSGDESTRYRKVMLQDGLRLWTESPRNFVFGVGTDSIKKYWREWGMFEGGNLPMGHFHSTPLQLLVERGLPALLIWLFLIAAYIGTMWRELKHISPDDKWRRGIMLGSFGGTVGSVASSVVHYNYGDQEVVMTIYLIMGIVLATVSGLRSTPEQRA